MLRVIFSSSLRSTGVNPSSAMLSVIPYKKVSIGRRFESVRYTEFFFLLHIFFLKWVYSIFHMISGVLHTTFLLGLDILSKNWGILDNKGNGGRKFASYPGSLFSPSL